MSTLSLSPGFFDPDKYRTVEMETIEVVVPQNAMEESPNAFAKFVAWFASSSPGCQCGGGGERRGGITKVYTY
jgi:hypothetical protein